MNEGIYLSLNESEKYLVFSSCYKKILFLPNLEAEKFKINSVPSEDSQLSDSHFLFFFFFLAAPGT